jgi:phospholipid/cholesterol/gamma-HCH transport system substrate-binding protein
MSRNVIETVMGGVVLLVAAVFLGFAYTSSNLRDTSGYTVVARFNSVEGVSSGTDVRLSGIKIGTVVDQRLDPDTYLAELSLSLDDSIKLPTDTVAKILADGLLGGTYVALTPGAEDDMIAAGGEIRYTQDPVNLTDLIGRFMFSAPPGPPPGQSQAPTPAPAPAPEQSTQ